MLASTNDRMLAAISRRIDLDGRLDEIVGKPPQARYVSAASVAMANAQALLAKYKGQDQWTEDSKETDLGSQILRLIDQIDFLRGPADGHLLLEKDTAENLLPASSLLKRLQRGLEARELGRSEAQDLLRSIGHSLIKAINAQGATERRGQYNPPRFCAQPSCTGGFSVRRNLLTALSGLTGIIIAAAIAGSLLLSWSLSVEIITFASSTFSVMLGAAAWVIWMNTLTVKARARMHGWQPYRPSGMPWRHRLEAWFGRRFRRVWQNVGPIQPSRMRSLYAQYLLVQERTMKLFDETDDRSPQCAPRI